MESKNKKKTLLVVDLQKQFKGDKYDKCLEYIEKHREEYDRIIATLFVNDASINRNFIKKLKFKDCRDAVVDDIEFATDMIIVKNGYGLQPGIFGKKDKIDIIGCETDACVLATCFSLWDDGIDFNVLWNYVYTNSDIKIKEIRKIYKRNFGI